MDAQALRAAALGYAERGWHVFPCYSRSKKPATPNGFKDATRDFDEIARQWTTENAFNIGIATGAVSNLVVVDIDPKSGGPESWRQLRSELGLTDLTTYSVTTGTLGTHYYFTHPGAHVPCRVGLRPGVDIRADGGYVIAAGSIHENGRDYRASDVPLQSLPGALWAEIQRAAEKPAASTGAAEGMIVEGGRNDYLMRVAGLLRRPGLHEDALSAALIAQNGAVCVPPLPEAEVRRIAQNISRYEPSALVLPVETDEPWVTAASLMGSMVTFLRDKKKVHGTATGIDSFDKLMGGGKRLGEVTAWHAEAKTGKNSLWHKFMHIWLARGIPLAYASREINPCQDVLPNLLSLQTQSNVWTEAVTEEREKLYGEAVGSWPLYFSKGYGTFELPEIHHWVKSLHAIGVEYFWFDHLHFMLEDPEDHKAAARLIKGLKILAQELKVHVDIIIQPNRLEEGKKLSMHSLKGGAVINQTVDNLLILERNDEDDNVIEVKLELGRSKLARRGKFYLRYNEQTTDYIEVERSKETLKPSPERPLFGGGGRASWVGGARPQKPVDFNAKRIDE